MQIVLKHRQRGVKHFGVCYFPLDKVKFEDGKVTLEGIYKDENDDFQLGSFTITEALFYRLKEYAMD